MLRLLADENLDGNIIRGLQRRVKYLNIVRVQDVGLSGVDDPEVSQWASENGRVLVTHDVAMITHFAYERVGRGLSMPGVIEIVSSAAIGQAVEELSLVTECYEDGDLEGRVLYLPL